MKKILLGAAILASSVAAQADVWRATEKWNSSHEARFGQWIKEIPADVFSNSKSRYYGISTDCADAAYTLRTIFAFENRLPVKFRGDARLANTTKDFDAISNDWERVKKFINRVNYDTGTYSLPSDTYPVAIRRNTLVPGTMFVHASSGKDVPLTYRSGHVYYIQNVRENGQIKYISSTVPQAVRTMGVRVGIDFAPQETGSGYRAWKWPDSEERPGYSDEQFQIGGWRAKAYGDIDMWDRWQEAVQSRVRTRPPSGEEQFQGASQNLRSALQERVAAVQRGWNVYNKRYARGTCMNESDYDDHSTPTRDVKIQNELQSFEAKVKAWIRSDSRAMKSSMWDNEESRINRAYESFRIEVIPGYSLNFREIYPVFMTKKVLEISEPEHSPEVRWGIEDQGRWVCPHRAKQYKGGHLVEN